MGRDRTHRLRNPGGDFTRSVYRLPNAGFPRPFAAAPRQWSQPVVHGGWCDTREPPFGGGTLRWTSIRGFAHVVRRKAFGIFMVPTKWLARGHSALLTAYTRIAPRNPQNRRPVPISFLFHPRPAQLGRTLLSGNDFRNSISAAFSISTFREGDRDANVARSG